MKHKLSYRIMLDTRRANVRDQYPVVLYVYYGKHKKLFPLGFSMDENEYYNSTKKKPPEEFQKRKEKIDGFKEKADRIVEELEEFSIPDFEIKWNEKEKSKTLSLRETFSEYISKLEKNNQVGSVRLYNHAYVSLDEFEPGLLLKDIDVEFLENYEAWMIKKGNSKTTIGIYLRNLRAVFNVYVSQEIIPRRSYPFGKGKYSIPKGSSIKKALKFDEIGKIYDFVPEPGSKMEKAKDFWLFSYFGNGMNPKDICRLKYRDIHDDNIKFFRAKTQNTIKEDLPVITVYITEEMWGIIDKYGTKGKDDDYIFPILKKGITPQREMELKDYFVKMINEGMADIRKELKIPKKITTYVARHSFATILKKTNTNPMYIKEALGHMDLKTTEKYLEGFELDTVQTNSDKLRPTKNKNNKN